MTGEYPSPEGFQFNPDRMSGKDYDQETKENVIDIAQSYERALSDFARTPRGTQDYREMGQIVGKMSLRLIEGFPVTEQAPQIKRLDHLVRIAGPSEEILTFTAGVKGEFCSGAILHQAGLETNYPERLEDLFHQVDLAAKFPDGKPISVQTKTLPLPEYLERGKQGSKALPVLSLLRTPDDMERFTSAITQIRHPSPQLMLRLKEIKDSALLMHQRALRNHSNPVFCVLGSPESEGSDMFSQTARPTKITEEQAQMELEAIQRQI